MVSSLTLARQPAPPWLSRLWAVTLSLATALVPCALRAQTSNPQEISTREVEPTFKLQSERNMVMVRVVVRDAKGAVVENLRKEDFQLFDHGKSQTLLHFSLEKPALKAETPAPKPAEKVTAEPEDADETTAPALTAQRFVAMYFDDVNTPFDGLARARNAADHFLATSVQPGDRVALYTSSGQKQVDFTDNKAQVHQALSELHPRPVVGQDLSCGAIPPYQAFLIVDQNDSNAIAEASGEMMNCNPCPSQMTPQQCLSQAQMMARSEAIHSLSQSEVQTMAALRGIESIVRRLTTLPGQRSMVIISAGFLTETLHFELSQITDRALRAGVIINAIDVRGLWIDPTVDSSQRSFADTFSPASIGERHGILMDSAREQTEGMQGLALDTGGIFFNNNNDLDAGFRKVAGVPAAYYLLAFSPQNLKFDGRFHPIQVKLAALKGATVQARRGYFSPRKPPDPAQQEKEEIREVVFSQDETHELPLDVHTQFFMKTESDARITVLTRIDLRPLQFRKEGDRNLDTLTFVTVLFDRDGHAVSGQQRALELHMHDVTLERYRQSGITMRNLFDVKPGTYLVRAVVRDSESGQITGLNRTVEIPY